jgi:hypothetical protein
MNTKLSCLVAALLANAALPGCGGSSSGGSAQPSQDAGAGTAADAAAPSDDAGSDAAEEAEAGVDHGMPSETYPAFKPDVGQLVDNGGYVMKQPVIVPITWNSDPAQSTFDSFVDGLGASAYWQAITKDYAVGAATSGTANHVHMSTAAPMTLTETMDASSDLVKLVTANAGKTWPAPTKDTLYVFFLPPGTSLLVNSGIGGGSPMDACSQGIGGYHSAVAATTAGANDIAYAVVPSCSFPGRVTVAEQSTMSMSHEIIEATTDPFSADQQAQNIGWYGFDSAHFGWTYFNELQSENGDVCEFYKEAFFQDDSSFPYWVQRIWSNASAAAGHHPCVPTPSGAYFNVTPLDMGHVNVTVPGVLTGGAAQTLPTEGVRILNGQSATFMIGFYSDGPTGGPWTISASSGNPILGAGGQDLLAQYNMSSIKATIDKTSGQNGEKAQVTVNVTTSGSLFKGELLTITSTLNGVSHYMPIWIGGE